MNRSGLTFDAIQFLGLCNMLIPRRKTKRYDIVIVKVDAIGDYIIWRDALIAYKEKYKGKSVLLICADIVKPLAESELFFSEIITFNRKKIECDLKYFLSIQRQLLSISAEIVINPVWQRHRISDFFVKSISANQKVAMRGAGADNIIRKYYNHSYTTLIDNPNTHSEIIAVEFFTRVYVSDSYHYGYSRLEPTTSYSPVDGQYAVVAISSSSDYKSWEPDKFAQLIATIPEKYDVVLSGAGSGDWERGERILELLRKEKRDVKNLINQTSLKELISLISKATFVIGNDSSAVHIAAACHVPSICIAPGAHLGRFIPYPDNLPFKQYSPRVVNHTLDCYGCNYICIRPILLNYECVRLVSVDDVRNVLNKMLLEIENDGRRQTC